MKKLSVCLFLLAFLAGCNQNQNADNLYGENEHRDGTSFVSNRLDRQKYNTREWTMDEQNPNFLNFDGNKVNNQSDIDKARQIIDETGNYELDSVWINGDDMWVTAYKKGVLSDGERVEAAASLRKKLLKALPRYHIVVKIQEDRT